MDAAASAPVGLDTHSASGLAPEMAAAAAAASPVASSPASSSGTEDTTEKLAPPAAPATVLRPTDPASDEDAGDTSTATGSAVHGLAGAFGMMKDRAATAKKTLAPQLLNMRDKTSKKLEKYQPTIDKAKVSATAAASKMREGSTQGWSMLKTTLAAAGPVAERIQTMGLNVMTDIYLGDTTVEGLELVQNSKQAGCLFLENYKPGNMPADSPTPRAISNSSVHSVESDAVSSPAEQCLSTPYVLGTILLFCGDLSVLARVACVNRACRDFIAAERRVGRFCVRYGSLPPARRFAYWESTSKARKVREASEFDYDTYMQMALSKGDVTELIMTDVRRTYGRVAPHKRAANHKEEVSEEDLTNQLSEILHALAGRFPAVGYCQGMDYIAAHVLNKVKRGGTACNTKTESESAFWLLVTLFEQYGLHDMFSPGLHKLHVHCFQTQRLLELTEPALAEHFMHEKVPIEMFAVGWFQTLYLYLNVLPADSLDRIWDIFLFEKSWKILLRMALALLLLSKEHVMDKPIDEIMQFFNTFVDQAEDLLAERSLTERALRLKVTNNVLTKLQKQHVKFKRMTSPTKT
ncbi:hypothetical protein PHYBOEH_009002 [Phytophthora boehmeriae]|uniref:Rab-GAP TBC domain-containing protein n=1 Tax=Phytophthora boehmeriae TaxID=109152 RepID=A0A8T1W030_9STRA|nr:hypothetical protein PHYBOEH_009002 [Phytophthora boehmeriae]